MQRDVRPAPLGTHAPSRRDNKEWPDRDACCTPAAQRESTLGSWASRRTTGGVAAIVAQARILAGLAAQYRRVEAQVVWRRLEGNPAIRLLVWSRRGEEDLDPRVGILAADHVVLDVRVELAGTVAGDEPRRYAERPQHVTHRRGEILAVASPRDKEEVIHCIHAGRGLGRRERVREIARVAQEVLDRGSRVVWVPCPRRVHDLEGKRLDLPVDIGGPIGRGGSVPILSEPIWIGRAGLLELGHCRGGVIDRDGVVAG